LLFSSNEFKVEHHFVMDHAKKSEDARLKIG